MRDKAIKKLTFTSMFAALIFLATYLLHVPAGLNGGYIHLGDAFVYLSACMLPMPNAIAASAIGAGLSDLLSPGAAVWILPTIVIKSLCAMFFSNNQSKLLCRRNLLATVAAAAVSAIGYAVATAIIAGNIVVAVSEMPLSLIQSAGGTICFAVVAGAIDKTDLKQKADFNHGKKSEPQ